MCRTKALVMVRPHILVRDDSSRYPDIATNGLPRLSVTSTYCVVQRLRDSGLIDRKDYERKRADLLREM